MESIFSWQGPEYVFRRKHSDWYWAVIIIAGAGAAIAYLDGNALFAVFVILAGLTLIGFARRRPRTTQFFIQQNGVQMGTTLYPWNHIKSFVFEREGDLLLLTLFLNQILSSELSIPLPPNTEQDVRQILIQKGITEQSQAKRFIDIFSELLGL